MEQTAEDREAMDRAFNAYKERTPSLAAPFQDGKLSTVELQARCWSAWKAFEAGWLAAKGAP